MRNSNSIPSDEATFAEYVRERLDYDPETGVFVWKPKTLAGKTGRGIGEAKNFNARFSGKVTGNVHCSGYLHIRLLDKLYRAHRLAWLYVNSRWPAAGLDHINGITTDNRIINLRESTCVDNGRNMRARHNSTGFSGVARNHNGFMAQIYIVGKRTYLGTYATPEEANAAYRAAVLANGFDPLHGAHAEVRSARAL